MASDRKAFVAGAAVGVGLMGAVAVGAGIQIERAAAQGHAIQPVAPPSVPPPSGAPASFADEIQRVAPAVVSIVVTSHVNQRNVQIPGLPFQFNVPGGGDDDQGGDDNDDNGGSGNSGGNNGAGGTHNAPSHRRGPTAMAAGSGFFISPDGYIVTNNHVVENADTIKVTLSDQRELTAHLVGRDPVTDLAVIKVDGSNFSYVNFETQAKPRVGDWVIAIGNPYALGGTVTAGIVSAERRSISTDPVSFLQIDAPINRGNSGGPTFDVYGRVIGVNTAIFSESGGSVGIGFAIPSDLAQPVVQQLIAHGHVSHGYLGVAIQSVTPDIAASQGIASNQGALVGEVTPGGPAALAGVQVGDIILSVNGTEVHSASDLSQVTAMAQPGDMLRLRILRNGRTLDLVARSGTRPANLGRDNGDEGSGGEEQQPAPNASSRVLGMNVAPLTDALRQQYNIGASVHGVVITRVGQDSEAAGIGIHPGLVITRAGERNVMTAADVDAAVADARRAHRPSVLLFINENGRTLVVPLKLDSGANPSQK